MIRKSRREQLLVLSHIWLTASSYMTIYLRISLYSLLGKFNVLFCQCILANKVAGWGLFHARTAQKSLIFFTHSFCSMIHDNYQNKDILIFYVSLHCLLGLRSRIQHNNRINVHKTASQYQIIKTVWSIYYKNSIYICKYIPLCLYFWRKHGICILAIKFNIL